jgi:hypothetical protein
MQQVQKVRFQPKIYRFGIRFEQKMVADVHRITLRLLEFTPILSWIFQENNAPFTHNLMWINGA